MSQPTIIDLHVPIKTLFTVILSLHNAIRVSLQKSNQQKERSIFFIAFWFPLLIHTKPLKQTLMFILTLQNSMPFTETYLMHLIKC